MSSSSPLLSEATLQFVKQDVRNGNIPPGYWHRILKVGLHTVLKKMGLEIRRVPSQDPPPPTAPPIVDDPLEALFLTRGGQKTAFHCPIDRCVKSNGLSFSPDGWHYFVATLDEYERYDHGTYDGSVLERYFTTWQPANALEALIGCPDGPDALKQVSPDYPPNAAPWGASIPPNREIRKEATFDDEPPFVESFIQLVREHGYHSLMDEVQLYVLPYLDGAKIHGPLARSRARIEHARILHTYDSIQGRGFDRSQGHISVIPIQRGDDFRFRIYAGNHRIAAMSALGYETVPAVFKQKHVISTDDVDYWPHVRSGLWDRDSALRYVDHLFDFDARAWARDLGLSAPHTEDASLTEEPIEDAGPARRV